MGAVITIYDDIHDGIVYTAAHKKQGGALAESLGARIALYRKHRGLSQQALAKRVEIGQGSVSRWEAGIFEPCASELQRLATALGLNIHYLITGEGPEAPPGAGEGLSYRSGVQSAVMRMRMALDEIAASSGADPAAQLEEIVEQSKGEGPTGSPHLPLPAEKAPRRRALEG